MIITFTNQKGGVGKTTLATILSQSAIGAGLKNITLIDLDNLQHNFTDIMQAWNESGEKLDILPHIPADVNSKNFVVIDTPPAMGEETEKAIQLADVVVAPMDRGISSITGLQKIIAKNKNTIIVINRFNSKKAMDRQIFNQAVQTFSDNGVKVFVLPENSWINNNINYRTTWNTNMSDTQAKPFAEFIQMILRSRTQ